MWMCNFLPMSADFLPQFKDMHFGDRLTDESKLTLGVNRNIKVSLSYVGPVMLLHFFPRTQSSPKD